MYSVCDTEYTNMLTHTCAAAAVSGRNKHSSIHKTDELLIYHLVVLRLWMWIVVNLIRPLNLVHKYITVRSQKVKKKLSLRTK